MNTIHKFVDCVQYLIIDLPKDLIKDNVVAISLHNQIVLKSELQYDTVLCSQTCQEPGYEATPD